MKLMVLEAQPTYYEFNREPTTQSTLSELTDQVLLIIISRATPTPSILTLVYIIPLDYLSQSFQAPPDALPFSGVKTL